MAGSVDVKEETNMDRLSSLPDELLCQILSSVPTKDAAIVSLSSKKMRSAFMHLTSLNFDDSPISYFDRQNPKLIARFQNFKKFVNNVLEKSQSSYLSKFILGIGGDKKIWSLHFYSLITACSKDYFPDLEATMLNAWISFPLSRCVREIELRILVGEPGKLPSALFSCETLEVLKLDTNLDFDLVSSMSEFNLPILKVLKLYSMLISEDDFVTRLVSNCPSLEELCLYCRWKYAKSVVISSPSLQKLVLLMNNDRESVYQRELLNIDTPNLKYFEYDDDLALHNSVTTMKALVQASIDIDTYRRTSEKCFREMLNLLQPMRNVQHLTLKSSFLEKLDYENLKKNQLPIFHNLKHLVIDTSSRSEWDDTACLFEFLTHSPVLEVLEFPVGIDPWDILSEMSDSEYHRMIAELEPWFSGKNQVSRPYCCEPHLKRVVVKQYSGTMWEVKVVRFLLEIAPDLEELLVICDSKCDDDILISHYISPALAESTLKKLPMASSTCLITVQ